MHIINRSAYFRTFLLFYTGIVLTIASDPGIISWIDALRYDLREGESILIRIVVLTLTSVVVCLPLLSNWKWLRLLYSSFLVIFACTGLTFRMINGQFSLWEATMILNELNLSHDAVMNFSSTIIPLLAFCILGLVLLNSFSPKNIKSKRVNALLCLPVLIPVIYLAFAHGGYWITHFTLPMKVPYSIAFSMMNPIYSGPRDEVSISPNSKPQMHVVLLVDESIRGDYLTINNTKEKTTPFLSGLMNDRNWINYGVISSMTNCSATANMLLRTGVTPAQLPHDSDQLFKQPTLYQFANKAGYKTLYLDAQIEGTRLNNLLSSQDIAVIDEYIPLRNKYDVPYHELDHRLADEMVTHIKESTGPLFIYANKIGTHFPYSKTFPPKYKPNTALDEYRNAIHWNVDEFFRKITTELKQTEQEVFVLYTSDHGQGLGEDDNLSTHCLPIDVPDVQARVPLLVGTINTELPEWLSASQGAYSQFQVFSSLVRLMGYDNLPPHYAQDLSERWESELFFLSGDLTGRGQLSRNTFAYDMVE